MCAYGEEMSDMKYLTPENVQLLRETLETLILGMKRLSDSHPFQLKRNKSQGLMDFSARDCEKVGIL